MYSRLQRETLCYARVIQDTCSASAADINLLKTVLYNARFWWVINPFCDFGEYYAQPLLLVEPSVYMMCSVVTLGLLCTVQRLCVRFEFPSHPSILQFLLMRWNVNLFYILTSTLNRGFLFQPSGNSAFHDSIITSLVANSSVRYSSTWWSLL